MHFSALLLVFFMVAAAGVLFAVLPRVLNDTAPRDPTTEDPARQPDAPPRNMAQFLQPERPVDTVPPEEILIEAIPPQQPTPAPTPPPQDPPTQVAQQPAAQPQERPADTRERGVFMVQVENEGADLRLTRVSRTLGVSNTPLIDTLNALLSGPTAQESARDTVSFIPPNTRILSVRVEGHTAYVDLNEAFQFNPHGSEGLRYQIWQIVYTATEFPNVHDVQILIEGNRVDFLHVGGIRIGSPIGR